MRKSFGDLKIISNICNVINKQHDWHVSFRETNKNLKR